jgi:hypothetical protein
MSNSVIGAVPVTDTAISGFSYHVDNAEESHHMMLGDTDDGVHVV